MIRLIYFIIFLLLAFAIRSQSVDSVLKELRLIKDNKKKIQLVFKVAIKKGVKKDVYNRLNQILDSLELTLKTDREKGVLLAIKGHLLKKKQDYNSALVFYFKALNFYDKSKDTNGQMNLHYEIGAANFQIKNLIPAKKHFYSALYYSQLLKDNKKCSDAHAMIGTIFKDWGKFDSSLYHHNIELELSIQMKDNTAIANAYNNFGLAYKVNNQHEKALEYLLKSLSIRENLDDKRGIAGANINIGNTLKRLKRNKEATPYFEKGIALAKTSGNFDFYLNGLVGRARNLREMGDYKRAANELNRFIEIKDSITKLTQNKQLAEMEVNYQTEKKDADIILQRQQIRAKVAENSRQKILIIASVFALLLSFLALFFIYRSFKLNKKNAIQLANKNNLIQEKNKEITDSINYAFIIQQSLLAPQAMLDKNLKEYFILYKPKDIVSGDFYWCEETTKGFLMAAVDCTGHGVPGAFMSLIGKENLDKAVAKTNSPKEILSELNKGVKKSLSQNSNNGSKDGMDAVIIKIKEEGESVLINYSGANRPLWIIKRSTEMLQEIKATKHAIGGFTSDEQIFDEHQLTVNKGDMVYVFTDGYADQFGGDKNKKMTTKRLKELVLENYSLSCLDQKKNLEDYFNSWKGIYDQLDDLLVIGIRI